MTKEKAAPKRAASFCLYVAVVKLVKEGYKRRDNGKDDIEYGHNSRLLYQKGTAMPSEEAVRLRR